MQDKIKGTFDNIRNCGLSSLVFSIGIFIYSLKAKDLVMLYYYKAVGLFLLIAGVVLLFVNSYHAVHLFFPDINMKSKALRTYAALLFFALYMVIMLPVFSFLAGREIKNLVGAG